MRFGSLFSGIGGFDLGFERAGMECAWQVEIDKACQGVLARRFNGEIHSDVKTVGKHNLNPVDLICGGFPCQDLSVAGRRAGLAGERSGLWFEFHRILAELRPGWVVIENVPGLLSSNGGRDFAVILRGLVELGYGVCWRILDAQYYGVAQRRRRVFVVGHLGNGRAAEVLFELDGGAWDTAPSREKGARVAHALGASPTATGRLDPNGQDFVTPWDIQRTRIHDTSGVAPTLAHEEGRGHGVPTIALRTANTGANGHGVADDVTHTLDGANGQAVVFTQNQRDELRDLDDLAGTLPQVDYSPTLNQAGQMFIGIRRLTPTECERLQGFPDGWTDGQSDSARYRQLGNAVAVPVIEWIAKRIREVQHEI